MKWMQFFTPVKSIDWQEAERLAEGRGDGEVVFLDVRQPKEYAHGHRAGATLIPLGDLDKRLGELDPEAHIIIY